MKMLSKLLTTLLGSVLVCSGFAQQETLLIGPGDLVHLQVFDTPEMDQSARVNDRGYLPLLSGGEIQVASLTPAQASRVTENYLMQAHLMNAPRVLITVTESATKSVSVFGQVVKPGSYPIGTSRTLVDVLSLAGGFTELASRHVTIERSGSGEHALVFVPNAPKDGDEKVLVHPGDRIIIPKASFVYVLGDVGRAGAYPMNDNQSSLTVLQLVAQAGGLPPTAAPDHARLVRRNGQDRKEMPLHLYAMQKGKLPDEPMQADDILYVPFSYARQAALGISGLVSAASSAAVYAH